MSNSVKQNEVKQVNRRSFLKGTAAVGAVAAASTIGAPAIHAGAPQWCDYHEDADFLARIRHFSRDG